VDDDRPIWAGGPRGGLWKWKFVPSDGVSWALRGRAGRVETVFPNAGDSSDIMPAGRQRERGMEVCAGGTCGPGWGIDPASWLMLTGPGAGQVERNRGVAGAEALGRRGTANHDPSRFEPGGAFLGPRALSEAACWGRAETKKEGRRNSRVGGRFPVRRCWRFGLRGARREGWRKGGGAGQRSQPPRRGQGSLGETALAVI